MVISTRNSKSLGYLSSAIQLMKVLRKNIPYMYAYTLDIYNQIKIFQYLSKDFNKNLVIILDLTYYPWFYRKVEIKHICI